jgi:dihydrofolate reductase
MGKLFVDISVSLDGFVAGPNQSLEQPLGEGGEGLHEWVFGLKAWRQTHGLEGGETNADSEVIEETMARAQATIMGRRMFSGGAGPWEDDPNAHAWWGDNPPFHHPVFVLTHHPREQMVMQGGTTFTFVTEGIESALEQARAVPGGGDIGVSGGGEAVQQYLAAGLIDDIQLHVVPVLLGSGSPLFGGALPGAPRRLECTRSLQSPTGVQHLRYRVIR